MDESLRAELLSMIREDFQVRERLARDGSLFDGYHEEMRAVHDRNAARLATIIERCDGWPGRDVVGEDGAEASFLVAQHAIAQPEFQRNALELLQEAVAAGRAPLRHAAYLEDRIRTLESRPQRYGTQFDWDPDGKMSPLPIEEPEQVDQRRAEAGLRPLAEEIRRQQEAAELGPEGPPEDWYERAVRFEAWRREVGWVDPEPS